MSVFGLYLVRTVFIESIEVIIQSLSEISPHCLMTDRRNDMRIRHFERLPAGRQVARNLSSLIHRDFKVRNLG